MDTDAQKIKDIILSSSLQNERKKVLVTTIEKDGITKDFFKILKQHILEEARGRKDIFLTAVKEWNETYASALAELRAEEQKNSQRLSRQLSATDSWDTDAVRTALDAHARAQTALCRAYEKKLVQLGSQHTEKILKNLFQTV